MEAHVALIIVLDLVLLDVLVVVDEAGVVAQGEFLSTTPPFFEQLTACMDSIHLAQTLDMMEMLIFEAGILIDAVSNSPLSCRLCGTGKYLH